MNLKIRELAGRVASKGVTFSQDPKHRKLEPGEIMECPDDIDWSPVRHLVEETSEPATRPFIFANESEAKYTSPSFVLRFESDQVDVDKHKAAVAERMAKEVARKKPGPKPKAEEAA